MNTDETAIRLTSKLSDLTSAGKIAWRDAGQLGAWGDGPGQSFKTEVEEGSIAQIAEVPIFRSAMNSYYFGLLEGEKEVFEVLAEGVPADPTPTQRQLWRSLKSLYAAARDSARGTQQKVEKFEQLLERLA
jgi:hypothetical protein